MEVPSHPNVRIAFQHSLSPIPVGVDNRTQRGQNPNQLPREQRAYRAWNTTSQQLNLMAASGKNFTFEQGLATDILKIQDRNFKDHTNVSVYLHEDPLDWEFNQYTKVFVFDGGIEHGRLTEMHVLSPEGRYYVLEIKPFEDGENKRLALNNLGISHDERKPVKEVPGFRTRPGHIVKPDTAFYAQ